MLAGYDKVKVFTYYVNNPTMIHIKIVVMWYHICEYDDVPILCEESHLEATTE